MLKEPKRKWPMKRSIISSGYASQVHTYLVVKNYNNQWLQLSIIQPIGHIWK